LTENVAFLIDFDPNLMVFAWTDGHTPLWKTCCEKATSGIGNMGRGPGTGKAKDAGRDGLQRHHRAVAKALLPRRPPPVPMSALRPGADRQGVPVTLCASLAVFRVG